MPRYVGHVQLRGGTYYAVLGIPAAVRHQFEGRLRFVLSLKTPDLNTARQRALPKVAEWRAKIAAARAGAPTSTADADAKVLRGLLSRATSPEARRFIEEEIADLAHWINPTSENDTTVDHAAAATAQRFYDVATGAHVATLEHLDAYLDNSPVTDKTKNVQRGDVAQLAERFPFVSQVTRRDVQGFLIGLAKGGLTQKTLVRKLSAYRQFWKYLTAVQAVSDDADPFGKLVLPTGTKKPKRGTWTVPQLHTVHAAIVAKGDQPLADLMRLAAYTGARRGELCSLTLDAVHLGDAVPHVSILDSKTTAGVRTVPLHSALIAQVTAMVEDAEAAGRTSLVNTGRAGNKYNDNGSDAMGTRFGKITRSIGFSDGTLVFHSIRKSTITAAKVAGVPETVAADLFGHKHKTMTYGHYADTAPLDIKAAAINKLDLGGL